MKTIKTIFLASSSPRRKKLLIQIADNFNLHVKVLKPNPKINMEKLETPHRSEMPKKYVNRIALKKALTASEYMIERGREHLPMLAADTTVAFKDKILGKPKSKNQAAKMLKMLSNNSHKVFTSVVLVHDFQEDVFQTKLYYYQITQCSTVWLGNFSDGWLNNYIESGEPMDKSGGYGIQGKGQEIIKKLNGSYSGVMGLPLFETSEMLLNLYQ